MAIDAKVSLLRQIEMRCRDILTVTDMSKLMEVISDAFQGYKMEAIQQMVLEMHEDDLLDAFIASMKVQSRSEKTINRYKYVINRFMAYANVPTRQVNVYHVRNWIASEKERGIQDSTLEGNRQVLSAYFGWLFRESLIEKNPIVNVGVIKVAKKQKKIYSEVDLEKLNQSCETLRDKAILHFLRSTGCRISEMTGLDRDMINLDALECVVHGKGNKDRTVYMDAVAGMVLGEYLDSRKDDKSALVIGKRHERLEPGGVRVMLKKLGNRAGVEHVHPHKFRRTLATELARHGMEVQYVASVLGHDRLDTTMKYVVLNKDDTRYSYRRYS